MKNIVGKIKEIPDNLKLILKETRIETGEHGTIFYDPQKKNSYIKFKDGRVYKTSDIAKDWVANNPKTPIEPATYISPFTNRPQ